MAQKVAFFSPIESSHSLPLPAAALPSQTSLRKTHHSFLNFSYVCPEPVLVKRCILYIKAQEVAFFAPRQDTRLTLCETSSFHFRSFSYACPEPVLTNQSVFCEENEGAHLCHAERWLVVCLRSTTDTVIRQPRRRRDRQHRAGPCEHRRLPQGVREGDFNTCEKHIYSLF